MLQLGKPIDAGDGVFKQVGTSGFLICSGQGSLGSALKSGGGFLISKWPRGDSH